MAVLGSVRNCNVAGAMFVLASGEYLTFRIDPRKEARARNLVLIEKYRIDRSLRADVDPATMKAVRRAVAQAISFHRGGMQLPVVRQSWRRPMQLKLI